MTENKSIETLKLNRPFAYTELQNAVDMAIQALAEIQQYRAIGTVEHIQLTFELCKGLDAMTKMYEAIGTIDEFKALKKEVELYRNLDKTNFSDGYNKAIDEFAEKLNTDVESFVAEIDGVRADLLTLDYFSEFVFEVAEQLKGVQE